MALSHSFLWVIFRCVYIHLLCPLICGRTLRSFPCLATINSTAMNRGARIFLNSFCLDMCPGWGLLDHMTLFSALLSPCPCLSVDTEQQPFSSLPSLSTPILSALLRSTEVKIGSPTLSLLHPFLWCSQEPALSGPTWNLVAVISGAPGWGYPPA